MQKFNSIDSFISELESLANEYVETEDTGTPIHSSTAVKCSDFISSISADEWEDITDIITESRSEPDVHKQDEYLYTNLKDLDYTDDEISDIIEFAEVY